MMKGYFKLKVDGSARKISFRGVAFGGHYGGHNVNIEISQRSLMRLQSSGRYKDRSSIDELLAEVQRRILTGDMTVEYDKLKQGTTADPFGNVSP